MNHLQPMASSGCCTAEGTDTDLGTHNTGHPTLHVRPDSLQEAEEGGLWVSEGTWRAGQGQAQAHGHLYGPFGPL